MEHILDPQKIAKSFSSAADAYDMWAKPHPRIAEKLISLLPEHAGSVLELGCGTGILTELLCSKYPEANITAIDIAPQMVEQCQKRCNHRNVSLHVASAEEFQIDHSADLVVSSSGFHWFYDKKAAAQNIRRSLVHGGRFAVAMAIKGIFHELHTIYEEIKGYPPAALWEKKECVGNFSNLSLPMETTLFDSFQMEETDPWTVLRSVHGIGAVPKGFSQLLCPSELRRLVQEYSQRYKSQNGVAVTYNTFYGITEAL